MSYVAGRNATNGELCNLISCRRTAVSTFFLIDDQGDTRPFGSACERHIIAVHGHAEKALTPNLLPRGAKLGRVSMFGVEVGMRIVLARGNKKLGSVGIADVRTGAEIAIVLGKRRGGYRSWIVTTDLGEFERSAQTTMWCLP